MTISDGPDNGVVVIVDGVDNDDVIVVVVTSDAAEQMEECAPIIDPEVKEVIEADGNPEVVRCDPCCCVNNDGEDGGNNNDDGDTNDGEDAAEAEAAAVNRLEEDGNGADSPRRFRMRNLV